MSIELVRHYFRETGEQFFVYNNLIHVNDIPLLSFHELLSHGRSYDLGGQYKPFAGKSLSMLIHEAVKGSVGELRGKSVLDLGTSIGHFAFLMAEDGADVTGIEMLRMKVDVANAIKQLRGITNFHVVEGLIEDFLAETDEHFDLVLMHSVFEHLKIEHTASVLKNISRVSGRLFTTIFHPPEHILANTAYTRCSLLIPKIYGVRDLWACW